MQSHKVNVNTSDGKPINSKTANGKTANGKTANDIAANSKTANDIAANGKTANGITAISLLTEYKKKIIQLAKMDAERRFISDSFTRWYLNSKIDNKFIPTKDVVDIADLEFANKHRQCRFDISRIRISAKKIHTEMLAEAKLITKESYPNQDNLLSAAQLERLKSLYKGKTFEVDKNKLIAIYNFIGMNSAHLSIPPMFGGIELFGSPLNTHNPFCSPFDFEKKFGSLGSFFDFNIAKSSETFFTANPPFDETIMTAMAKYLDEQLAAAKVAKTIVITIPVWDSDSQKKLGIRDFGMQFEAFNLLKNSKYLKEHEIFDRGLYPYWDYYKQRLSPVSYTHLIILANKTPAITMSDVKKKWQEFIETHKAT